MRNFVARTGWKCLESGIQVQNAQMEIVVKHFQVSCALGDPGESWYTANKGLQRATLRRSIIVPGGLITSTGVVLVVLVLVFVVPGAILVIIDVVASHYGY